jgi:photosystem II stability/assembly factor-like uncharacterized protein
VAERHPLSVLVAVAISLVALFPCMLQGTEAAYVDFLNTGVSNHLYGISWKPDGSEALVVGDQRTVLRYMDASKEFTKIEYNEGGSFLLDVAWRPDSLYALVVGSAGSAFAYNGQTLVPYNANTNEYFYDVNWKADSSEALLVGSSGMIMRFKDGSFTKVDSGTTKTLFASSWRSIDGSALIVGAAGTVLRMTADGKVSSIVFTETAELFDVAWLPGGTMALIVGGNGIIATYNGTNFNFLNKDTLNNFLGCCWRPGTATGLICGDTGIIIQLTEGRLKWIEVVEIKSPFQTLEYRPQGDYLIAVGNSGKAVKYPGTNKPNNTPCFLESPLMLAGITLIGIALLAVYLTTGRRSAKNTAEREAKAGERKRHRKKKMH